MVPGITRAVHAGSAAEPSSGSRWISSARTMEGRSAITTSACAAGTRSSRDQPWPSGAWDGSRRATAPGMPSTPTAHRLSWSCTRSRMNGIWFFASLASVKQNSSRSCSMNARGVQENTCTPSKRPPVSGTTTSPLWRRGGAQKRTLGNGAGSTPRADHASRAPSCASNNRLDRSSQSRSSPLTLNTRTRRLAAPVPTTSGAEVSMRRKNRANEVLVATPEIPLMDMWPPLRPSKKSRSTWTGAPSRPSPMGNGRSISSAYRALRRSSPVARATSSPGSADTHTSGSTRVTATRAVRTFAAGMMPSSAIRCVSDSYWAPSYTASASVMTP